VRRDRRIRHHGELGLDIGLASLLSVSVAVANRYVRRQLGIHLGG